MIFQEPMTSLDPMFTIGSEIMEVLKLHHRSKKRRGSKKGDRIASTPSSSQTQRNG